MLQFLLWAIAGAAISVSGSNVTWDFTINPDGSGKVAVWTSLPPLPPEAAADKGTEEVLRLHFLRETLFLTGGVDVWANVSMDRCENGNLLFKGTAYFPDVTKVGMGPSRDGQLTWAKDPNGGMTLVARMLAAEPTPAEARKPALTDTEITQRMADLRQTFKDRRESLAANLGRMNVNLIYRLPGIGTALTDFTKDADGSTHWIGPIIIPGTVTDVVGFTKATDGSLHWALVGAKVLETYEKAMADDAFLRQCVVDGKSPLSEVMAKEVPSVLSARVTGDLKPQFDYEDRVKMAKEAWPALRDKLGLVPPPGKGEPSKTESAATPTAAKQP